MAKAHSMDISVAFDFQEMKNAVEQAKKEAGNRYDLKDANVEIELSDDEVKITTNSEMHVDAVFNILVAKMVSRKLSEKVLDKSPMKEIGGMRVRQDIKLVKALDSESAKKISKMIRDSYPKSKPQIQGDSVRVTGKSIDELQEIIAFLRSDEKLGLPLEFGNYK